MKPIEAHKVAALAITAIALTHPAFAQASVDPGISLKNLFTYGLILAGLIISVICLFKGAHAVAEGRHLGPILMGLVGGVVIAFGGPYLVTKATGG